MRYRPFTAAGVSISALTLDLPPGLSADAAHKLVFAALECGVNGLCFCADDPASLAAVREAVASAGRRLLILIARLHIEQADIGRQAREALLACAVDDFDAVMVELADAAALTASVTGELSALRAERLAPRLALSVEREEVGAACVEAFGFDVLALRFNIASGWPERNLLRKAASRGMTVLGFGHHVETSGARPAEQGPRGLTRFLPRKRDQEIAARYAFLQRAPGWRADEITLAYALTEPGLASILVRADGPETLERLAAVPERELPAGVAAQIEMARFSIPAGRRVA